MAENTPENHRNLVIYEVFVRNHSADGKFADVEADLERIASMGVDVVWFMPIHPIGRIARKGTLGSPYSITDYRAVNPEYGTFEDFQQLIKKAHRLGLSVWIDVVYNHTAHDSVLLEQHSDWYHQDEKGNPITTVPAWSDVIDLKHPDSDLWDYLINSLKGWVEAGVDGFRCDVASLLPVEFWLKAREAVAEINPNVIWLAESVHASFVGSRRQNDLFAVSDSELYRAFDITYDYDIWPIWQAAVQEKVALSRYLEMLRFQDCIYPANYVKMRCVENHDQPRIMAIAPSENQAIAWTAFAALNKGAFLIYAGQESGAHQMPSLFDKDDIKWADYRLQPLLTKLAKLKKDIALTKGKFSLLGGDAAIQTTWYLPGNSLYGVFNTPGNAGKVDVYLPDGTYQDEVSGRAVQVVDGSIDLPETFIIFRYSFPAEVIPEFSVLLDYHISSE